MPSKAVKEGAVQNRLDCAKCQGYCICRRARFKIGLPFASGLKFHEKERRRER